MKHLHLCAVKISQTKNWEIPAEVLPQMFCHIWYTGVQYVCDSSIRIYSNSDNKHHARLLEYNMYVCTYVCMYTIS